MLMRTHKTKGFTLVELMMAVAILGIIATIALPSYQNAIRKSKRQVAISDMLLYKQAQERYRTAKITYGAMTTAQTAIEGDANYSVNRSSKATDYTIAITATAQGKQALGSEVGCTPLTLNQADARGPNDRCWAK
jgi:type IV pilus assembly protein PilE